MMTDKVAETRDDARVTVARVKVLPGWTAHARFLAECDDAPIGTIPRIDSIPSPYASSDVHYVWNWHGVPVIIVETRHRRLEVFRVTGPLGPVDTD